MPGLGLGPCLLALVLVGCASGPTPPPASPALPSASTAQAPDASSQAPQADIERQSAFDRSMARWHGARLQELLAKLGAPDRRKRLGSGEWQYTYVRSTTLRRPAGPQRFSCIVHYRVDARRQFIVGHQIQGC